MKTSSEQVSPAIALDKKDFEILSLLQHDAKLTVRDIAQKVHLSATPTHERIKRMERDGVIKRYVALLDNRLVNRSIMVLCTVSLKDHDKRTARSFIQAIQGFPEVIECYNISGEADFQLKIISSSMEAYHKFYMNRLSEIKGIGQTKSSFVMDVIKETHQVL